MAKWLKNKLPFIMIGVVCVFAVLISLIYFRFTSQRIFEDSTVHLEEVYGQVDRAFGAFIDRNWALLDSCDDYFALADRSGGPIDGFIAEKQEHWGFTSFYFLSGGHDCMTAEGDRSPIDLGSAWDDLSQGEPILAGVTLSDGRDVTVFAAPASHGEYNGFAYDAIAISYTNADLAASLDVDAFSGRANCFVIHNDGTVLLSTQTGGNVFNNYLAYLGAASDLAGDELDRIRNDWLQGRSGLVQCKVGGVDHCILYLPVEYQDYFMLSAVPLSAVSAGFLSVQKTTIIVLAAIFLLVGASAFTIILLRSRKRSRRDQTELQYRELMFDVLSNGVDDIFIMLSAGTYTVDYVSPNIQRLLGISAEEARRDIRVMEKCAIDYDVVIPRGELGAIPLNGSRFWECEYMHQNTGERRWYRMTVYHLQLQEVEKYVIVLSDRTQERQNNQQLQQALTAARSANEAKSNFLSNMSHDIRTPMNAIVGFSVLLERNADQPDKVREYTRKISSSSQHLLNLINDVLDMSKIESGKTSLNVDSFSLPGLLDDLGTIILSQAKAKDQRLTFHVQGTPPETILGDKLRLNQILINLLSNAVKYTPEGGNIDFTVRELPQPAPQYTKLQFVVKDDGIGMSEEFQQNVFAPFSREINSVTNKIQGTGLGMAITKNLVDLMGGVIWVESAPGVGTTFTVELSFALPETDESGAGVTPAQSAPAETPAASPLEGRLFLMAEDNELNAEILSEMLDMEGARCELAVNGQEAVDMFLQSEPGRYDMILMDVQMPVMNGYDATRAIRASAHPSAATIPIVALTANTFAEDVRNALDAGMDGHLAKPIDMNAMRELVGRILNKAPVDGCEKGANDHG